MERWVGRVAIVTGASSGIGAAIARLLAEKGMRVVAVARRLDRLKALADECKGYSGKIHPLQCDVTKEEDITRVVQWSREKLGGADVLVNSAGLGYMDLLSDGDTATMKNTLDVNVLGLSMFTRDFLTDVRARGVDDAHVIHINSNSGHRVAEPLGLYMYCASKNAVTVLTEGLRRELRDLGTKTRVTSISPGLVRTEILEAAGMPTTFTDKYFEEHPYLEPRDIAEALLFALAAPPHVQVHELLIQPTGSLEMGK